MIRLLIPIGVLTLANSYVAWRLIHRWPWAGGHAWLIWGLAALFMALQLVGPFGERLVFSDLRRAYPLAQTLTVVDAVSFLSLGLVSCLAFFTLVADLIALLWHVTPGLSVEPDFNRRALLTLGAVTVGSTVVGVRQAVAGPAIRHVEIPLANLPAALDGFRIIQLSDLHVGPLIGADYVRQVVRTANGWQPDLIALTGDFVDGTIDELRDDLAPLRDLTATHGSYFVSGNHEYYWGGPAWIEEFRRMGLTPLVNQHTIINHNGGSLALAGVTDHSTRDLGTDHASDPIRAAAGIPDHLCKILLAHQPATYQTAHQAGFDLQLSGHTHSGQYFPFNLMIGLFHRYYRGLNRHESMWVYVNSGTGFWGPPLRTGVPAEITAITLRATA